MARRRNLEPWHWGAIGVSATVFGVVAYGALQWILKKDPGLQPVSPIPTVTREVT